MKPKYPYKGLTERQCYHALRNYTSKCKRVYDPSFEVAIKSARPDWSIRYNTPRRETTWKAMNKKKHILLSMMRSGAKRPINSSKNKRQRSLASFLSRLTNKSYWYYDAKFAAIVQRKWPLPIKYPSSVKKVKLLELAKGTTNNLRPRNTCAMKLGAALTAFTTIGNARYDKQFDNLIRSLRPRWFVDVAAEEAEAAKPQLLALAQVGGPKPIGAMGIKLRKCINTDEIFAINVKSLCPQWFVAPRVKSQMKKQTLLAMAAASMPPPLPRTALWYTLHNSTCRSKSNRSYDSDFERQVNELRPDWTPRQQKRWPHISMANKKEMLLAMAKDGSPRPTQSSNGQLAGALGGYTNKKSKVYDRAFDETVRKLAPAWFVPRATGADTRAKLLELAAAGKPKPSKTADNYDERRLGYALYNYTYATSQTYKKEFARKIKRLRPDWFPGRAKP